MEEEGEVMIDCLILHAFFAIVFLVSLIAYCLWMREKLTERDKYVAIIMAILCVLCWEYVVTAGSFKFVHDLISAKNNKGK